MHDSKNTKHKALNKELASKSQAFEGKVMMDFSQSLMLQPISKEDLNTVRITEHEEIKTISFNNSYKNIGYGNVVTKGSFADKLNIQESHEKIDSLLLQ